MAFAQLLAAAVGTDIPNIHARASDSVESLQSTWNQYIDRVKMEVPSAIIQDGGETVYMTDLSPGCRACKKGSWDCLFLTMDCNLSCSFCCSPGMKGSRPALSALGREIGQVIANLKIIQPEGISFSGGEAFLKFDQLRTLVTVIRREFPTAYLWAYTNGLLATSDKTAELGQIGLDEIRFNMAAAGYSNPQVLENLHQASRSIETVSVEIPAIPDHAGRLMTALSEWSRAGVKYLNLHELMYEPGSQSASLPGPRAGLRTPDGHYTEYHPESRLLALQVMQQVESVRLPIAVNDCSMQNKLRQVRGRRMLMGHLMQDSPESKEVLGPDGLLQTICVFDNQGQHIFVHPDQLADIRSAYQGWYTARLWREPPLSIFASTSWLYYEEIQ